MMFFDIDKVKPLRWGHTRGAILRIGSFSIAIDVQATESSLIEEISDLYAFYPQETKEKLPDLAIELRYPNRWSTFVGRQIQGYVNGHARYQPMPPHLGLPMLESGINWFISRHISRFLLLHAAVVERDVLSTRV